MFCLGVDCRRVSVCSLLVQLQRILKLDQASEQPRRVAPVAAVTCGISRLMNIVNTLQSQYFHNLQRLPRFLPVVLSSHRDHRTADRSIVVIDIIASFPHARPVQGIFTLSH